MPPQKTTKSAPIKLKDGLILHRWLLSLFGLNDFASLTKDLKDSKLEGWNEKGNSRYLSTLIDRFYQSDEIPEILLRKYDENIFRHTETISSKRHEKLRWKYFQYLSLLFTEIYLDRYFANKDKLLNDLNTYLTKLQDEEGGAFKDIQLFTLEELSKVAFWSATGSGKTFIMHMNILQYQHYLEEYEKHDSLNRIIILTPNEGLSRQHEKELKDSGFWGELFDKRASSTSRKGFIDIIDIHKLEDKAGDKTVAIESFEGNNLVLVDEGHRGASGEEWKKKRATLSRNGFSFEYSATFGQAIHASSGKKRTELLSEYSKSVLIDYSYKYFYEDGYGKDYRILNISDTDDENMTYGYLIGSMMTFYEQMFIYEKEKTVAKQFQIEKPLSIFVGGTVNAVRTENKAKVSDVIQILQFFQSILGEKKKAKGAIKNILTGQDGIIGKNGPLFRNHFRAIKESFSRGNGEYDIDRLYSDFLEKIFNCNTPGSHLHIENLKGQDGEIGLKAGNGDYFGVINVGDDAELVKLCESVGLITGVRDFSESLFHKINEKGSAVNILIGSKKFTEGWSSWRVSTMGLMNIGRSEGSEIIQLFGRGVRLKGYNHTLRRSKYLKREGIIEKSLGGDEISLLETLCVFGVRSDYMQQFREYLEEEGMPMEDMYEITIPIKNNFKKEEIGKLKYLKIQDGADFKKSGEKIELDFEDTIKVTVDWYAKVQAIESTGGSTNSVDFRETHILEEKHLAFIDWEKMYFELERHKADRSWNIVSISKENLEKLFMNPKWYTLYIPGVSLETRYENVKAWNDVSIALIKNYFDALYNQKKGHYYRNKMEFSFLPEDHPNLLTSYEVKVSSEETDIIQAVRELEGQIKNGIFQNHELSQGFTSLHFDRHLYSPLLALGKNFPAELAVISPVPLNEGERKFVFEMQNYYERNTESLAGKEFYLLRNLSKKGVGFFEAQNFYPDFIIWIIDGEKQYIVFVDPKGLFNMEDGFDNPKLRLHETLKKLPVQDPNVILDAYIISVTAREAIQHWKGQESEDDFEKRHVIFQHGDYIGRMMGMIFDN
ncbi:MAG: DEAD/DEAH box helicase family protein [Candidatus Altimarinota bacterium]